MPYAAVPSHQPRNTSDDRNQPTLLILCALARRRLTVLLISGDLLSVRGPLLHTRLETQLGSRMLGLPVKRGAAPPPARPWRKLRLLYILLALLALLAVGFAALVVYAAHCRPEDPGWVYWHYCDWFFGGWRCWCLPNLRVA